MPITPYDRPLDYQFQALPFDDVFRAGAVMQDQENKAQQALVDIGSKQYYSTTKDQANLMKAREDVNKKIEDIYNESKRSDGGVRSQMDKIRKFQGELRQREGQGGDLYAYAQDLSAQQAYTKDIKDQMEKGTVTKEHGDALLAEAYGQHKGIQKDDYGAYISTFRGDTPAAYANYAEGFDKLAKDWKANSIRNEGYTGLDGKWVTKTAKEIEGINPDEIAKYVLPIMENDPKYRDYANQTARLKMRGMKPNENGNYMVRDSNGYSVEISPEGLNEEFVKQPFRQGVDYVKNKYGYQKTKDEIDVSANAYELQNNAKKLEDQKVPLTSFVQRVGFGSEFKSPEDIETKKSTAQQDASNVALRAKDLKDAQGNPLLFPSQVKLLELAALSGKSKLSDFAANSEQRDAVANYLAEINQNLEIKKRTEDYENRAKTAVFGEKEGKNWKPSKEAIEAGEEAAAETQLSIYSAKAYTGLHPEEDKKRIEKARTDAMKKADPKYKEYRNWLETNASKNTELIGVTTLPSHNLEKTLAGLLETHLTEQGGTGAKDFKTGTDIAPETFAQVGNVDPAGIGYYLENGEVRLVARPTVAGTGTKDNPTQRMDYMDIKAPAGTLWHIMNSLDDNGKKELVAKSLLDNTRTAENGTVVSEFEGKPITIRALTATDKASMPGKEYEIRVGETVGFLTQQEAIGSILAITNKKE